MKGKLMIKAKIVPRYKKWQVQGKLGGRNEKPEVEGVVDVLLKNRKLEKQVQKKEFFNPKHPDDILPKDVGINFTQINKAIRRLKLAKKEKEKVIVYGDYDADGICATAILWETLYSSGFDVLPHIPDRFSEGYGLNSKSVKKLKSEYPGLGLIITVDNGIVANEAVEVASVLGVDVVITDHHQKGKKLPSSFCVVHTDDICGAAVSWMFAREIRKKIKGVSSVSKGGDGLDLVAIGTIADQVPLLGANRSFVKHGLDKLNKTKRRGLLALFEKARISIGDIGTYHVGFLIAPRINAMGRLEHGIDSLRLLCTKDEQKSKKLAGVLNDTNYERQKIVNDVVARANEQAGKRKWESVIILAHEAYHEGVIGLAASKLVEKYYRPAIVISKGGKLSKASARSISGFNIIKAIRQLDGMLEDGGGHPMAAGFTIETQKIDVFEKKLHKVSKPLLTNDVLSKVLKIDLELGLDIVNEALHKRIEDFEPTGIGNPTPLFVARGVEVVDARVVGKDGGHLKMKLAQNDNVIDAIAFGFGDIYSGLSPGVLVDVVYNLDMNVWNGISSLQLRIRDIRENE